MPPDAQEEPVLMTLAFEDVREFQLQWEGVISHGSCFVPWPRPLVSEQPVRLHVIVVGAGKADLEAIVDFNDVDSFGRNGSILKLPSASVEKCRALFERAVNPPRPSAPGPLALQQVAQNFSWGEQVAPASSSAWPGKSSPLALSALSLELPPVARISASIITGEELPPEPPVTQAKAPLDLTPAPPPVDVPPAAVETRPVEVQPAPVEAMPSLSPEGGEGRGEGPAPVEVKPAPVEVKPAPVEVKPAPVEVKPAPVEVAPATVEVGPALFEVQPAPVEAMPSLSPEGGEGRPAPVEVKPAAIDAPPAPVEVKPAPVEVKPAPVEVKPAPVESAPIDASDDAGGEVPVIVGSAELEPEPAPSAPPPPHASPQPPPQPASELATLPLQQGDVFATTRLFKADAVPKPPEPAPAPKPSAPPGTAVMPAETAPKSAESQHLEPGTLLDNRFQIESHIATGGMGDVYRAAHVFLKRPIALKLLKRTLAADPEMWARFQREAELVSQLESQHIVRVFDFGRTSAGMPFLAMEFVQGTTLDVVIHTEGAMPPERAVDLVCQVCEGLNEAHGVGIIHRDLKPPNIMIGKKRDGTDIAKILDFGIARAADTHPQQGGMLTQLGMVVGTPAYLAPEQALADSLDARTDIYALGCVLFEMLTGRTPFVADSLQKMISLHLREAPPSPQSLRKDLSPALCEIVLKALSKDRAHRWQSVKELAAALRDSVKRGAAIPGAFDDWPPADAAPAAQADAWPPPAEIAQGTTAAHDDAWPPAGAEAPAPAAPAAPIPERPEVDSFFKLDTGRISAAQMAEIRGTPASDKAAPPQHRLELALATLKVNLSPQLKQRLTVQRSSLEPGTRKLVMLHVEVLRAPVESGARANALARALGIGLEAEGVVDSLDEDGITFLFYGEEALVPGVRALYTALEMREAVAEEVLGATLRAAAVFGRVTVGDKDEPIEGELPLRARTFAAKAAAGKIVADRQMAIDVQDVVTVAEAGSEVVDVGDRRAVLHNVPTLYGRDTLLAALDKRLTSLSQGIVAPVLVTGEPGSGRSTVAQELGVRGRHQQAVVGIARASPSMRSQPYSGLAELLCNVCGVPKDQRLTRLPQALEGLKLPPPELEAALVIAGARHVPQPFTPGQAVYALRAVLSLGAVGRKVLLVFDGLESMDPYTVDAFREMSARPVQRELTVGLCDAGFAAERFPQVPALELRSLQTPEAVAMVTAWLGGARVSEKLIETVHRRSRGLPGLMIDWLHVLSDRGLVRFRSGAYVLAAEPPSYDDNELATERVKALWPDALRLFETACLAGDSIDGAVLNAVLPNTPQSAYQRLVGSRLLRALGGRRWAITSDRYLRVGLALQGPRRAELHSKLATVLMEAARAAGVQPDATKIAEHLTAAKDATRSLQLWRSVVESALKRRAPREVLQGLRGWSDALAVLLENPQAPLEVARARVETLARAAANAIASGEPLIARQLIDEAQALATAKNVESPELALSLARVLRSEARRAKAGEALEMALRKAQGTALVQLVWAERGEAQEAEGDLKGAVHAFRQALTNADQAQDLARWHGEIDFRARVETRLAGALLAQKDVAAAKQLYASALAAWRRTGYPYAEARVLANMGALHVQAKESEEAARCFKEAAAAAARSGDLHFQARQMLNLAKVAKRFEALAVARQAAELAKRIATLIGWEDGKAQAAAVM